jgi:hypothetical protein
MDAPRESHERTSTGLALGLVFLWTFGCSTSAPPADDASAASMGTCQSLRLCAFDCADDACVQTCRAKGTASAQVAFDELEACTTKACAKGDVNCACGEQCLADGSCLTAVDACLGTAADPICDNLCH